MKMNKVLKLKLKPFVVLSLLLIIVLLSTSFVYAQAIKDSDNDGIRNTLDACKNTSINESLPIITTTPEYAGCSCQQLNELIDEPECAYVYCAPDTELIVKFTQVKHVLQCQETYCDGNTLYSYDSKNETAICSDGHLNKKECTPVITKNSNDCKNGLYKQKSEINKTKSANLSANDSKNKMANPELYPKINLDKLYSLIRDSEQKDVVKLNKEDFENKIDETQKYVDLNLVSYTKQKNLSSIKVDVLENKLNITSKGNYVLSNMIIIEQILNKNIDLNNFIFSQKPIIIDTTNNLLVWKINKLDAYQTKEISYELPKSNEIISKIYVLGDKRINLNLNFWIPFILVLLILAITYLWFKKEIRAKKE